MLFADIKLIEPIQKALVKSGYVNPTPIQSQAIPAILEHKDLIGIAQTGTGKTAAFTLPILQLMYNQNKKINTPRALILAPTRELAAQIGENIENYGKFTGFRHTVIFGGVKQYSQEKALKRGVDIVIATPGRLLDLRQQGLIDFKSVEFFVLDEADRMLDMGFLNDVKKIMAMLPKKKQSLCFSATMSPVISNLLKMFLVNPIKVEVAPQKITVDKIEQGVFFVNKEDKNNLLLDILKPKDVKSAIVFTRTKHKANKVAEFLCKNNVRAQAIHGNKSQSHRIKALDSFKRGSSKVLVATDIVARGIDIDDVSHVINYELPNEPENYVHRIGRTARAGNTGIAYAFCAAEDRNSLRDIEQLIKQTIIVKTHEKHSEFAQNATGANAKLPPKKSFVRNKSSNKKEGNSIGKKKFKKKNNWKRK